MNLCPPQRRSALSPSLCFLVVLLLSSWTSNYRSVTSAFVVRQQASPLRSTTPANALIDRRAPSSLQPSSSRSSSKLYMAPILNYVKSVTLPLTTPAAAKRLMLLVLSAAMLFLSKQYKKIFWPGSGADSSLKEPLPPGSLGCPLFGNNIMTGTRDYGPYPFFHNQNKKYKNPPSLLKLYTVGMPMVSVTGKQNIDALLKNEFDPDEGASTMLVGEGWKQVFGEESIIYESDGKTHGMLRRLVGTSMKPNAISAAVPSIQVAANKQVDRMLASDTVKMQDICTHFTLDIAWRQILGLDLTPEEIPVFHEQVTCWINGMFNPLLASPIPIPGIRFTKSFKSHKYLVNLVQEKLDILDANGPDGSTLSGIYFATDDEGDERKLTRQQVIDNALILILAGSETSSNTLTVASLLLGLHQEVWHNVKQEQAAMVAKCGNEITSKAQLDAETPYLDAVIKETLRIRPIPFMELRRTKKSTVLNGMQIPQKWMVLYNVRSTHDNDPVTKLEDGSHMDIKLGFKPERWADPATRPSDWMPFGSGARRCLGENLAMTEMKVFLATLARRVDYDLVGPTDKILWKRMSVIPTPLDGVEVAARPAASTVVVDTKVE